jgi:tetratricopeptide (TPR) repeat protein
MNQLNISLSNLKKFFILFFITFHFCFLACCDSEKSTINRGHRWFDRGKFSSAVQTYSQAIKINPSNPDSYYFRGLAKLKSEDKEGAKADFTVTINMNPNYLGAYINRGIIFKDEGNLDKALEDFNKALELKPDEYKTYLIRANVWFQKGDFEKAIDDSSFVIKNNPLMAVAYRDRADAYYWKQNYEETIKDYKRAIELNPKDSFAYNNLAWILSTCEDEKYRDGKSALLYAKKAVDLNPNPVNLSTYAAAYAENRMFEDAVKIMKKIVFDEKNLVEKNSKYLNLFLNHQPLREKPGD